MLRPRVFDPTPSYASWAEIAGARSTLPSQRGGMRFVRSTCVAGTTASEEVMMAGRSRHRRCSWIFGLIDVFNGVGVPRRWD